MAEMKRGDVLAAAVALERVEQLERCLRLVKGAKDLTLNTAGHTLLQIRAGEKDSLFPEIVAAVCRELEREIFAVSDKMVALGVE